MTTQLAVKKVNFTTIHSNKKGKFEMFLLLVQVFLILISFDVEWLLTDLAPRPELLIIYVWKVCTFQNSASMSILLEVTQKRIGALLLFSFGWWIMEKALNVHIRTFIIHEFEFDYYNWKICEQRCKVFFKMINQSPFADHQRHYYYYYITSTARWSI